MFVLAAHTFCSCVKATCRKGRWRGATGAVHTTACPCVTHRTLCPPQTCRSLHLLYIFIYDIEEPLDMAAEVFFDRNYFLLTSVHPLVYADTKEESLR